MRQSSALSPKPPAHSQGNRFTYGGTYRSGGSRWKGSVVTEGEACACSIGRTAEAKRGDVKHAAFSKNECKFSFVAQRAVLVLF